MCIVTYIHDAYDMFVVLHYTQIWHPRQAAEGSCRVALIQGQSAERSENVNGLSRHEKYITG